MAIMDAIDYDIFGDDMQYVEVELDPGRAAVGEAGMLMFMQDGIEMETVLGDGSVAQHGLLDKLVGAGKRLLTGESLFITIYANTAAEKRRVAFAAPYPGKIIPVDLGRIGGTLICQKDAFLCAARGVNLGIAFQRRLGAGIFGGEGFVLQKLAGDGMVFFHAGGTIAEKTLAPGESIRVDTGCIAAMQPSVDFDIRYVGKIKTALFGGEGLFLARLTGPGKVWLQTLPFSRLADRILAAAPSAGGHQVGEGPLSGGLLSGDKR
ncbi:MAG TPA: TIGR00266 family protein [Thiobacillaceae bacterium]|nr:TIGR00266 family protein [Thiobacillaceae bacterium]HNU64003.1 TIGR00266 family protein [Thiobacillaceae bacterium]